LLRQPGGKDARGAPPFLRTPDFGDSAHIGGFPDAD
jgi:hypothetical protein